MLKVHECPHLTVLTDAKSKIYANGQVEGAHQSINKNIISISGQNAEKTVYLQHRLS